MSSWNTFFRIFRTVRDDYLNIQTGGAWSGLQSAWYSFQGGMEGAGSAPTTGSVNINGATAYGSASGNWTPILLIGGGVFLLSQLGKRR
jgi:hypothetical protein